MHVYDVVQKNVERRGLSTMHGRAITSFYISQQQTVNGTTRERIKIEQIKATEIPFSYFFGVKLLFLSEVWVED
jgi:hypothetical protein